MSVVAGSATVRVHSCATMRMFAKRSAPVPMTKNVRQDVFALMVSALTDAQTMWIAVCNHQKPPNVLMGDALNASRTNIAQATPPAMMPPTHVKSRRCVKRALTAFRVVRVSMAPVKVTQSAQRHRAMQTVCASKVADSVCQTHPDPAKPMIIALRHLSVWAKVTVLGVVDVLTMPNVDQTEPVNPWASAA